MKHPIYRQQFMIISCWLIDIDNSKGNTYDYSLLEKTGVQNDNLDYSDRQWSVRYGNVEGQMSEKI